VKVVILAGGLGTRLAEETEVKPKPMVDVGGRPIIWHIMKHYARHGFNEFVVALGYRGEVVKQFFLDYAHLNGSLTLSLADGEVTHHDSHPDDWVVHLVDTGPQTNTGGRVARLEPWISDETFMLTYGDGVSNVNIGDLLRFHKSHGKIATLTAVRPPARFGALSFGDSGAALFLEKPQTGEGWINGGYMVFEPELLERIEGDETILESHVLEDLAADGQLMAYAHDDFWQCVDTLRDLRQLRALWDEGKAPWVTWS
jgi:glucose-1-phosphate cytidylyltransferase